MVPPMVLVVVSTSGTLAFTSITSATVPAESLTSARVGEPTLTEISVSVVVRKPFFSTVTL